MSVHRFHCRCGAYFAAILKHYIGSQVFPESYLVCFNCPKCGSTRSLVLWESAGSLAERLSERQATFIHGEGPRGSNTVEYRTWSNILQRCRNPKARFYSDYGGRGINVCDRWASSYVAFLEDMGRKPSPELTIERLDNNKGYEPGNCIWATRAAQRRNRRDAILYEFRGQRRTIREIAKMIGVGEGTLALRLRAGWDLDRATVAPPRAIAKERVLALGNETLSVVDWAARLGVTVNQLRHRIRKGWSVKRALTTPFNANKSHKNARGSAAAE